MNLKMHLLFSHLDQFPESNSDFSDEQGERTHQHLKPWFRRYCSQDIGKFLPIYAYHLLLEISGNTSVAKGKTYFKREYTE